MEVILITIVVKHMVVVVWMWNGFSEIFLDIFISQPWFWEV